MLRSIVFALMDTLDVCPGGLTTFWLELSQAWRSPCTRAKALCSSDGGAPQAAPQDTELTTYGLLDGDALGPIGSLTFC